MKDMSGYAIGPVPPQFFLNRFLQKKGASNRRIRKDTFQTIQPDYSTRIEMAESFVGCIRDSPSNRTESLL